MEPIEVRMRNNLGYIVKENDLNNINKKIKLLLSAQNKWKKKIYKLRKKTVFNIGKSSEVGSNYIYSLYSQPLMKWLIKLFIHTNSQICQI